MGVNPSTGFTQVRPTDEEVADWRKRYPRRRYPPYRSECQRCGKRIWHSGIGIGAHRRACKGVPAVVAGSLGPHAGSDGAQSAADYAAIEEGRL